MVSDGVASNESKQAKEVNGKQGKLRKIPPARSWQKQQTIKNS